MKFNKFLWENYLLSEESKDWSSFFQNHNELYYSKDKKLILFLREKTQNGFGLWSKEEDVEDDISSVISDYEDIELNINDNTSGFPKEIKSEEERDKFFQNLYDERFEDEQNSDDFYQFSYHNIPSLSVALYMLYPNYFFPYYFYPNMDQLQKIFNTFGIFLPPVPIRSDENGRFFYYLELCKSLRSFWLTHDLDPKQIAVFIYGFCPKIIESNQTPLLTDLPKPNRAIFIGGGGSKKGDASRLDLITSDSQTNWGGGKEANTGDIVVMYVRTPRSEIHSIWRVLQPGSVEPFFHYYGTCKIGYPIIVPPVHLNELKSDPILSEMGLVRGNLQGLNGRPIQKKYYDSILKLIEKKGFNINHLPQLESIVRDDIILKNERDVEKQILEPLLSELGILEKEWQRQVKLQVGRKEKVIPDYLIKVIKSSSNQITAEWVWEAKFTITSHKQLEKDFNQVVSYAKLVGSSGVSLISKEGLWICSSQNQFRLQNATHIAATKIFDPDGLSEIRDLIKKANKK